LAGATPAGVWPAGRCRHGDLALDAEGRIIAAGHTANGADTEFALMRAVP
jgi:hypothetical protein